jgi:hypothetical protein
MNSVLLLLLLLLLPLLLPYYCCYYNPSPSHRLALFPSPAGFFFLLFFLFSTALLHFLRRVRTCLLARSEEKRSNTHTPPPSPRHERTNEPKNERKGHVGCLWPTRLVQCKNRGALSLQPVCAARAVLLCRVVVAVGFARQLQPRLQLQSSSWDAAAGKGREGASSGLMYGWTDGWIDGLAGWSWVGCGRLVGAIRRDAAQRSAVQRDIAKVYNNGDWITVPRSWSLSCSV